MSTTRTGRPIERTNVRRSLAVLSKQLGTDPPISPYELRHTLRRRPDMPPGRSPTGPVPQNG